MEQMVREAEEEATRQYEASRARAEAADRQAFEARVSATDDARLHLIASLIRCVARVRTTDDACLRLIASLIRCVARQRTRRTRCSRLLERRLSLRRSQASSKDRGTLIASECL